MGYTKHLPVSLYKSYSFISCYSSYTFLSLSKRTAQKIKFSIKDFFSKSDQTCSFLQIWSLLLEKSLMENFIFFCSVNMVSQSLGPCVCCMSFLVYMISNENTSKKAHYVSDLNKFDALLYKIHNKVLLVLRYQGSTNVDR